MSSFKNFGICLLIVTMLTSVLASRQARAEPTENNRDAISLGLGAGVVISVIIALTLTRKHHAIARCTTCEFNQKIAAEEELNRQLKAQFQAPERDVSQVATVEDRQAPKTTTVDVAYNRSNKATSVSVSGVF